MRRGALRQRHDNLNLHNHGVLSPLQHWIRPVRDDFLAPPEPFSTNGSLGAGLRSLLAFQFNRAHSTFFLEADRMERLPSWISVLLMSPDAGKKPRQPESLTTAATPDGSPESSTKGDLQAKRCANC
jgi:hypothetical protein